MTHPCGLTGCGACRSIHICRARCGIAHEPGPEQLSPARGSRATKAEMGFFAVCAIFVGAVSVGANLLGAMLP
jgi:hypothetical protein